MKQGETFFKVKKKYLAVMFICLLYGGFAIMMTGFQLYSAFWQQNEMRSIDSNMPRNEIRDFNSFSADRNIFPSGNLFRPPRADPIETITSPYMIVMMISGIISIIAGITIWGLIREKEIKKIKQEITNNLLLPDEKKIIDALKKSNNEMTQAKLATETGLDKVQVHRAVKRLESKGILDKHEYGLTNKIILRKEFSE